MASLVELHQPAGARVDEHPAPGPNPAIVELDTLEDVDLEAGEPLPWWRLLSLGLIVGLAIGLPLVPFSEPLLAAAETLAIAAGCPFHLPSQPIR